MNRTGTSTLCFSMRIHTVRSMLVAGAWMLSVFFAGCLDSGNAGNGRGGPDHGAAHFDSLRVNPKWYRTLDSSQSISISEGTLLFAWTYLDTLRYPDSFYIAIDTLWMLPQNVKGDTSVTGDWDLQICPDGFCQGGLQNGVNDFNSPAHFGGTGEYANPDFKTEHHFQFYPAVDPVTFKYTAPDSAIVGAMLFVRSRSGKSPGDTVFAFGAWKLAWNDSFPPPVHPVNGYLPKQGDFSIMNGKVRYTAP